MKRQLFFLLLVVIMTSVLLAQAEEQENKIFSLAECVSVALEKNPQILANQADIIGKKYSFDSSKKDLYPSLYFQYGYKHSPDAYAPYGIENYYNYAFTIEQPVYRGRSLVTGVELGQLDLDLSKANMAQTQNDIILNVHQAYYNLLKTRKFEQVAEQSVSDRKAHLKDAKAFYQAGLIPKNDMLQSEVQLANAQIALLRAKNLSSMALAQLNTLLERTQKRKLLQILERAS